MKIKTSELTGLPLRWAVAAAEGYSEWDGDAFFRYKGAYCACFLADWKPDTDWAQGGPIIEREGISLKHRSYDSPPWWVAVIDVPNTAVMTKGCIGPTPLIAAMRCFVASRLGDEVEIPEDFS